MTAGFALVTRWDCYTQPWNLLGWNWVNPTAKAMLLTVTVDRFIAVFLPLAYFRLGAKYAVAICSMTYGSTMAWAAVGGCVSYSYNREIKEKPAICFTSHGMADRYFQYYHAWLIGTCIASVVLYIPVVLKLAVPVGLHSAITHYLVCYCISSNRAPWGCIFSM